VRVAPQAKFAYCIRVHRDDGLWLWYISGNRLMFALSLSSMLVTASPRTHEQIEHEKAFG